jgi:hypothetical protein
VQQHQRRAIALTLAVIVDGPSVVAREKLRRLVAVARVDLGSGQIALEHDGAADQQQRQNDCDHLTPGWCHGETHHRMFER